MLQRFVGKLVEQEYHLGRDIRDVLPGPWAPPFEQPLFLETPHRWDKLLLKQAFLLVSSA